MAVNTERGLSGAASAETRPEDSAESEGTLAIVVTNQPSGVGTKEATTSLETPDHPAPQESKLRVHIPVYGGASEGMTLAAFQTSTKIPQ